VAVGGGRPGGLGLGLLGDWGWILMRNVHGKQDAELVEAHAGFSP